MLVRHGESLGNVDEEVYTRTPDWQIPLTAKGFDEALRAGQKLSGLLDAEGSKAFFYHSPYKRARATLDTMLKQIDPAKVIGVREEPRISEQQFGNLQCVAKMRAAKRERANFGRFFYRFPSGESALDVYSRVSSFIATIYRDVEAMREADMLGSETSLVIVSHGLAARTFVMRWFQLPVSTFELLSNQPNGSLLVLERQQGEAGQQWYELTRDSWALLNSEGRIDRELVRAHGKGFGSRNLVQSREPGLDGQSGPPAPEHELDGPLDG